MIWYWYVATPTELFIDMDRYEKSIEHARMRLQSAIEGKLLNVQMVYDTESSSGKHHIIILLHTPLPAMERFAWEMVLHSDIYRTACNMMRYSKGIKAADILISKQPLHRIADITCTCKTKHKRSTMENCPAAISLRGQHRTAPLFGMPTKTKCELL